MKWIIGLSIILFSIQAWSVEVKKIELFVTSAMPITNEQYARDIELEIIYLDEVEKLEQAISRQLPKTPEEAHKVIQQLIQSPQNIQVMSRAHEGQLKAWKYDIKHLPAAVINDGAGMIYGSTDVAKLITYSQQKPQ